MNVGYGVKRSFQRLRGFVGGKNGLSLEACFWFQPKIELKVRLKPMGFDVCSKHTYTCTIILVFNCFG